MLFTGAQYPFRVGVNAHRWTQVAPESVRGNPMHPREVPKQVQSRRNAQPGLGPGEALQQRVGLFWGHPGAGALNCLSRSDSTSRCSPCTAATDQYS